MYHVRLCEDLLVPAGKVLVLFDSNLEFGLSILFLLDSFFFDRLCCHLFRFCFSNCIAAMSILLLRLGGLPSQRKLDFGHLDPCGRKIVLQLTCRHKHRHRLVRRTECKKFAGLDSFRIK